MTRKVETTYFDGEGRPSVEECIHLAAEFCILESIPKIVMFTGTGEGPHYAARELLVRARYKHLQCVAVTPAYGRPYKKDPSDPNSALVRSGIAPSLKGELEQFGVKVVSAHLPFKPVHTGQSFASDWMRVAEAYGVLGGGFALCIQAVLVACDAGLIEHGERVVVLSADTAFVVTACRTESFLSPTEGLLVGHIICRPGRYNISKRTHETIAANQIAEQQLPQLSPAPALVEATGREVVRVSQKSKKQVTQQQLPQKPTPKKKPLSGTKAH